MVITILLENILLVCYPFFIETCATINTGPWVRAITISMQAKVRPIYWPLLHYIKRPIYWSSDGLYVSDAASMNSECLSLT